MRHKPFYSLKSSLFYRQINLPQKTASYFYRYHEEMKNLKTLQKFSNVACYLISIQIYLGLNIAHAEMSWKSTLSEHQNAGCPYNSICSKEMGKLFIKYHQHLQKGQLKKFFKRHGIPITALRKKDEQKSTLLEAIWDSPCGYKTNKKSMFERVMTFSKKFDSTAGQYPFYVLLSPKGALQKFFSSNDDSVLGFQGDHLIFNRLVEGVYYQYQVNNKGEIKIAKEQKITTFSKKITCSSDLLTKVSVQFPPEKIDAVSCREVYSSKGDKSYLFYLPRCE